MLHGKFGDYQGVRFRFLELGVWVIALQAATDGGTDFMQMDAISAMDQTGTKVWGSGNLYTGLL